MDEPRPTAVIVHYGLLPPTLALAHSLIEFDDGAGVDVVVVANDRRQRPDGLDARVEWLIPDRNLGYGDAFNLAISGRSASVYVLLNTDIVLPRATFDRCVAVLGDEGVGVTGPVLRRADGSLQSGAAALTRWLRQPNVLIDPGPVTIACTWVTGAAMFLRAEVARNVGMDGSYFLGAEDADLCVRAGRAGWGVRCCGEVSAQHLGSQVISGPRWTYYSTRNRVWWTRANYGRRIGALSWLAAALTLPRIALADLVVRRDPTSTRLALLGLRHALWAKPDRLNGSLIDEPLAGRVMRW